MLREDNINCCGCQACADICPKNCISFCMDNEGFLYPSIDESKCVDCHLCEKVCPIKNPPLLQTADTDAYYGVHQNLDTVKSSSSGGAFTAIYKHLLKEKYVVYGVKWQDHFQAVYDRATTKEECEKFRKSKYILADTKQLFSRVNQDLTAGEHVLVSGSPCVCAALKNYLELKNTKTDNLVLIDIVCHGAGSQKIFDEYIAELENEHGEVKEINFKFKPYELIDQDDFGKTKKFLQIIFSDESESVRAVEDDPFLISYYGRLNYRPYCKECAFARPERVSDITLGDAWGIHKMDPEYDAIKGVSLCLGHTEKGKTIINAISDVMGLKVVSYKWAASANEQLSKPTTFHKNRGQFFSLLPRYGFRRTVLKTTKAPLKTRIRVSLLRAIPISLKRKLKGFLKR